MIEWGPQQVSLIYAFWGLTTIFVEVALIGILVRILGEANLFVLGLLVYSAGLSLIPVVGEYVADQVIYLTPVILLACLGFATEFRMARSFWIGLGKTLQEVVDEDQDGKVSLDELTDSGVTSPDAHPAGRIILFRSAGL